MAVDVRSPCVYVVQPFTYGNAARNLENDLAVFARSVGIGVRITSRLRSCAQQEELWRAGRTAAAPTTSQHEWGFAFDIVPTAGYASYGASKADAITWLVALARYFGGDGIAEATHAHIQVYGSTAWRRFLQTRNVAAWLPIPGRRPRRVIPR